MSACAIDALQYCHIFASRELRHQRCERGELLCLGIQCRGGRNSTVDRQKSLALQLNLHCIMCANMLSHLTTSTKQKLVGAAHFSHDFHVLDGLYTDPTSVKDPLELLLCSAVQHFALRSPFSSARFI